MATFLLDTFATGSYLPLIGHVPDGGGSWVAHPAYTSANATHHLDVSGGTGFAFLAVTSGYQGILTLCSPSAAPASADYNITWNIVSGSNLDHITGLAFRYDPALDTGYRLTVWTFNGSWKLARWNAGAETVLATATLAPSAGAHAVTVGLAGGVITCLIDGAPIFATAATTDGSPIAPAGRVGFYDEASSGNYLTSGTVTDSLSAADPGASSFAVSPTSVASNRPGGVTLTLTGTATAWTTGSAVSVQNSVTGTTTVVAGTWTRTSATAATLAVTTGTGSGTFTVTVDGVVSAPLAMPGGSYVSTGTGGNWSSAGTWTSAPPAGGPGIGDVVAVAVGATVTLDLAAGQGANGAVSVGINYTSGGHAVTVRGRVPVELRHPGPVPRHVADREGQ